jgi:iron complex transport system substrate-binding protein
VLAVAVALAAAPCRAENATAATIKDDRGVAVALAPTARRIVTLAPSLTELAFAAGAGASVVAVSSRSDHPPEAARLPVVAGPGRIDVERIVALAPDLVLAWPSGNPARDLERLERRGVRVFAIEPRRLADVSRALRSIGALADSAPAAAAVAKRFDAEVAAATRAQAEPVRVFLEIWHEPLVTVSDAHLIGDLLARCGAVNVFGSVPLLTPRISREALYQADPDAVVSTTGVAADDGAARDLWRDVPWLRAARSGRVYAVDATLVHRQGPRVIEGLRAVCRAVDAARAAP